MTMDPFANAPLPDGSPPPPEPMGALEFANRYVRGLAPDLIRGPATLSSWFLQNFRGAMLPIPYKPLSEVFEETTEALGGLPLVGPQFEQAARDVDEAYAARPDLAVGIAAAEILGPGIARGVSRTATALKPYAQGLRRRPTPRALNAEQREAAEAMAESIRGRRATEVAEAGEEVRRAGNIRLDKLETPEDVKDLIEGVAEARGGFVDARQVRGVAETKKLADELGTTAEDFVSGWKPRKAINAEELYRSRQLLIDSAEDVYRLAGEAKAAGTAEARQALARGLVRHAAVQEAASGVTAETGRALRILRETAKRGRRADALKALKVPQGGADDLADAILNLEDPTQIHQLSRELAENGFGRKLWNTVYNLMLSGPRTHAVNVTSNLGYQILDEAERALSTRPRVTAARLYGGLPGFRDATMAMRQSWKTRLPTGALKGEYGDQVRRIPRAAYPIRALQAEDEFFKQWARRRSYHGDAAAEGLEQGLRGRELRQFVADRVRNPTDNMLARAEQSARELTFTQDLGEAGRKLMAGREAMPFTKLVVPFMKTPTNIVKASLKRSAGLLDPRQVRKNPKRWAARMAIAATMGDYIHEKVNSGQLTGAAPRDPGLRRTFYESGQVPYSIRVGDEWVSYLRFAPVGQLVGMYADLSQAYRDRGFDESLRETALKGIWATTNQIKELPFLMGISNVVKLIEDTERYGERLVGGIATMPFPAVVRQASQAQDPYMREPANLGERFLSQTPMSTEVEPRTSPFGDPIRRGGEAGFTERFVSPFRRESAAPRSPAAEKLWEGRVPTPEVGKTMEIAIGQGLQKERRTVRLTPRQRNWIKEQGGAVAKMAMERLVSNPMWEQATADARKELVSKVYSAAMKDARERMRAQLILEAVQSQ